MRFVRQVYCFLPPRRVQICGLGHKIRAEGPAALHGRRDFRDPAGETTSVEVPLAGEPVPGSGARGGDLHPDDEESDAVAHRICPLCAGGSTLSSVPGDTY